MKIKQRNFIRKSELNLIKDEILRQYDQKFIDQVFPKKSNVELIKTESGDILFAVNNELTLWKSKDGYIPVLTQFIYFFQDILSKSIVFVLKILDFSTFL